AVGVTSEGEYLEMELAQDLPAYEVMQRLNAALPPGLQITAITPAEDKEKPLMSTVNAADYVMRICAPGVDCGRTRESLVSFLSLETIPFTKDSKSGKEVTVDLRPGIWRMEITKCDESELVVQMLVETGSRLNVKPHEVIALWMKHAGIDIDADELAVHRRGLYIRVDGSLTEPVPMGR
ncbi:MAG: TIGR03936 family radical SAM-associated protein, partial [Bacillota bacterium]